MSGSPFFDFIEGEGGSAAVCLEQVKHCLRLFKPQALHVRFVFMEVLLEHGVGFHCKFADIGVLV